MRIKTSADAGEFLESVWSRVHAPNKAVLGRAGLFLALSKGLPKNFKSPDSQGIELAEETILGDELAPVVRAALNHRCGESLDESVYKQSFRLYFEYGCHCLKQLWEECSGDHVLFVTSLLKLSDFSSEGGGHEPVLAPASIVEHAVKLKLLTEEEPWAINAAGGNGLMVISGKPGSGKSQLALDLLTQISRQGVRFLFFDLKGELEEDLANPSQSEKREKFFNATGARYIRLISEGLPVNPMPTGRNQAENAQIASEIAALVSGVARFARCGRLSHGRCQRDRLRGPRILRRPFFPSNSFGLRAKGDSRAGSAPPIATRRSGFAPRRQTSSWAGSAVLEGRRRNLNVVCSVWYRTEIASLAKIRTLPV